MMRTEQENFSLNNFEGPLDFLLHLIQKKEIDIYEVSLKQVIEQYMVKIREKMALDLENGAEFIGILAFLVWFKSKMLLPKHEHVQTDEEELDPHFDIIHQLIEYSRFKDAAKALSEREAIQTAHFLRGVQSIDYPKKLGGVEHLSIDDLTDLFRQLAQKADFEKQWIYEEEWKVSDKVKWIKQALVSFPTLQLSVLFNKQMPKLEWIVTFLAVLELMKLGEIGVCRETETGTIFIEKRMDDQHAKRN